VAVIYCVKCDRHVDLDTDVDHMTESHEMTKVTVTRVKTKNDINGNPRRAWLIHALPDMEFSSHQFMYAPLIQVVEEGYSGKEGLVSWLVDNHCQSAELDDIKVSPSEYNRFIGRECTKTCANERYRILGG